MTYCAVSFSIALRLDGIIFPFCFSLLDQSFTFNLEVIFYLSVWCMQNDFDVDHRGDLFAEKINSRFITKDVGIQDAAREMAEPNKTPAG